MTRIPASHFQPDNTRPRTHPGDYFSTVLAVSECCSASLQTDPDRWVGEAARLLRPGGRLAFHAVSVLVTMCQPGDGPAGTELLRPQRDIRRLRRRRGVEFYPGHGRWIALLLRAGLVIDAVRELYAPPAATDHPYYPLASAHWSQRWPVEDLRIAYRPAA
jgi:hypothetical protein